MKNLHLRAALLWLTVALAMPAFAEVGTITTIAGNGTHNFCGDGDPAVDACFRWPNTVTIDCEGNLYVADYFNHRVRKIEADSGIIVTIAGTGETGFNGDMCPATDAQLNWPGFIAVDCAGNVFIGDAMNHRVRRVDAATGCITTIAGTGEQGFNGDNIPATSAWLTAPIGLSLDGAGNLYFADQQNNRVRRVDAATNIITTVAGSDTRGYCGDGAPATDACLNWPHGTALDSAGNLYIADLHNYRVRHVDAATGVITTFAGSGVCLSYGDGGDATSAGISWPLGVGLDGADNLFISTGPDPNCSPPGSLHHFVRRVDAETHVISTVAGTGEQGYNGDGIPATEAQLNWPMHTAVDAVGNLLICDQENDRLRSVEGIAVPTDRDGDGVEDRDDNCITVANTDQRDTDSDGIGNVCDADVAAPNDCIVNFLDLNDYRANFFQSGDFDTDNNGDGQTNFLDLNIVRSFFFGLPGPSATGCN